ncbi:MAG TPA: glycosyltransferase [Solirubrobacteraceae bacterium]|nr:glycosyltransferase [Solirubrobacteraceae bacterium]
MLILSADVGEGHAAAARALADELRRGHQPADVTVIDGLASMGRLLRLVVEDGYRTQLRFIPWSYSMMYWGLQYVLPFRWLIVQSLYVFGSRPLRRTIAEHDPDVVVSTYPSVTVVLARLRRRGHVRCPTMATITDLTGLFFWAQPGIDMHLACYQESAEAVERIAGRNSVRVVRPLIATEFLEPCAPAAARRELRLPAEGKVVLISGGGWGVGDIEGAVRELIRVPDATLVCLAGRNDAMRRKLETAFASEPRVMVLGFTSRMPELLAAADALVHSTGGVTCLEAKARGCPVISYGLPVGHARVNTSAMAQLDLLRLAKNRRELVEHVRASCAQGERAGSDRGMGLPAADVVLQAPVRVRPVAAWRARAVRLATQALVLVGASGWMLSTDELTAMAAVVLGRPMTTVATHGRREVALIVRAPQSEVPALIAQLNRAGEHASFAFASPPSRTTVAALQQAGDDALPELPRPTSLLRWVGTRSELHRDARAMNLASHRHLYFLAPSNMTVGQLFMAKTFRGARPVVGSMRLDAHTPGVQRPLRAGDVVVVSLDRSATSRPLDSVTSTLGSERLRAASLSSLG